MKINEAPLQQIRVALILVNYNGERYIADLFHSLLKMDFPHHACDIFFVDNASADGSVEWVRKNKGLLPFSFSIIENSINQGFALGNNRGIEEAFKKDEYDYIALLNIDTTVDPFWLSRLVSVIEQDSAIGAAQSLILFHDTPDLINTSGNVLHYLGFGWSGEYQKKLLVTGYMPAMQARKARRAGELPVTDICYASGAAVLYRVRALRKVGLLEERFFMYHEDLELSWRLRLAGYRIVCSPESIVYHKYQFSRNQKKWFWVERNRLLTFFTMYRIRTILVFMPAFLFTEFGILIYGLINGWFAQKLRSYMEVLGSFLWIQKKRQIIGSFRRVSDREIMWKMAPRLNFQEIKNPLVQGAGFFLEFYFKIARMFIKW